MGIKQFNNYESLITFTRASGGHALRPVSYGDELVTNGTFDTDVSGWTETSASTSVSASGVEVTTTSTDKGGIVQAVSLTVGKTYLFSVDQSGANDAIVQLGSASFSGETYQNTAVDGSLYFSFVAQFSTTYISLRVQNAASGQSCTFDNASLKEVTFDQPDGTLTLFEHPENVPRVEYDADGNRLGLLVEEARTNLATYSVVTDANWNKSDSTINDNQLQAPNRITEAAKIVEDTDNNTHYVSLTCSGNTSTTYTGSFFLKSAEREEARVRIGQAGNYVDVWVDLTDGSLGNTSTGGTGSYSASSSTDYGNGWYRVSVTGSGIGSGSEIALRVDLGSGSETALYTGDGSSGIYVWGAQLEAGSFPTSYIKSNSGSTTTRSADVASIPVADFGYNQGEGTALVQCTLQEQTVSNLRILGGTSTTRWLYANAPDDDYPIVFYDGTNNLSINLNVTSLTVKAAISVETDSVTGSVNGSTPITRTHNGNLLGITSFEIFGNNTGYIKAIKYYPRSLTNAQLQDLTS